MYSLVKQHEVLQTLVVVNYIRKRSAQRCFGNDKYGSFVHTFLVFAAPFDKQITHCSDFEVTSMS